MRRRAGLDRVVLRARRGGARAGGASACVCVRARATLRRRWSGSGAAGLARADAWAAGRGGACGLGRRGGGEWRAQERGKRPGYGAAPRRKEGEGEGPAGVHDREGEKEGKGKKRKGKENGKEKWREKKRGRERDPRRDHGADRGACRPRVASGRARTRRTGREIGCRIRVSGLWEIGRSGGTGRIPEDRG